MTELKKLHLGCGLNTPEGWLNLDGSWNAWLAKYPSIRRLLKVLGIINPNLLDIPWSPNIFIHDVRKPLPFPNNSFTAIYASHLLEHLYLEEAKTLLKECYRTLEPKGLLRMVVPDLRAMIQEYLDNSDKSSGSIGILNKADRLNHRLYYRFPQPTPGSFIYKIYTALTDFQLHKWSYDAESLTSYFMMAGFIDVQEMQLFQSRIEGIKEIEDPQMILDGFGICIEGLKPTHLNISKR
jgi:predicted SAM-dependent methyltransferase